MQKAPERLIIQPRKTWWFGDIANLWRYREVVYLLIWRDFKVRYRQTVFGVAWALIQPLLTVAIFTMLFSRLVGLPSEDVPYPLWALAGFVPWAFFAQGVSAATNAMINNHDLVKRIYVPRLAIPLAAIFSGFVDLLIGWVLLGGFMIYYGQPIGWAAFALLLFVGQAIVVTFGMGLLLSAANARFRDVGHAVPFMLQIALLATPVGYASSVIPDGWRLIYSLNPMAGVIDGVRMALFGAPLMLDTYLVSLAVTVFMLIVGVLYFNYTERSLADIL